MSVDWTASLLAAELLIRIERFSNCGIAIPLDAVRSMRKLLVTIRELAAETEEENRILERRLGMAMREFREAKRHAVDIGPDGNVVRLPIRPRIVRNLNPDGGDAA